MGNVGTNGVLIDTNIIISHLRSKRKKDTDYQKALDTYDDCFISAITVYEVEYGALQAWRESDLQDLLFDLEVLPFGQAEAMLTARLDNQLKRKNLRMGLRAIFIAGSALANNLDILTENIEHFQRIEEIKLAKL